MTTFLALAAATAVLVAIPGPNVALIAVLNPKTLLFSAAFLPQFTGDAATVSGLGVVAVVFLSVLLLGDVLWAAFASSARPLLLRFSSSRNKVAGACLVAAGAGLALAKK